MSTEAGHIEEWRSNVTPPCTCTPRPGLGEECKRVDVCREAWEEAVRYAIEHGDHRVR